MMSRYSLIIALALVVASMLVSTGARRLAAAEARRDGLETQLEQVRRDAMEVIALRAREQRAADRARPRDDITAQVNRILAALALPSQRHFTGLRAGSDAALPGSGDRGPRYRRQTMQLSLAHLAPADLGAFLHRWRAAEPLWTPTDVHLVHARAKAADPNRYDVTITITAVYIDET